VYRILIFALRMKILLLADTYSEHTEKWALGLAARGIKVGLFSFNRASYEWYHHENITVFFEPDTRINAEKTFTKISYLKYVGVLKKILANFKPDILHAHYATSYGLVGALSKFKPFILSVWGSDVYDFPKRSKLHKKVFQYNLKKASVILSTSEIMREEIRRYTTRDVTVTPFGVDTEKFNKKESLKDGVIRVGTIKPIEPKYGIIYIIEAAEILIKRFPDKMFRFYLIGSSSKAEYYQSIINEKNLTDVFEITGRVPFDQVSNYHNLLDIFLNVSIDDSESFGVAAVEAMACEKPVIVSDVGGLMEVVGNGKYGNVIPKKNPEAIAKAIEEIILNPNRAAELGVMARKHVFQTYNWEANLTRMIEIYSSLKLK
jgi:L-malate glycosyltransferase